MRITLRVFLSITRLPEWISRIAAAALVLAGAGAQLTPARADGVRPLVDRQDRSFLCRRQIRGHQGRPRARRPSLCRILHSDQPHASLSDRDDRRLLPRRRRLYGTSDGRDGRGEYFLSKGYAIYIMDQVGRGRSPYVEAVYGPPSIRSPKSSSAISSPMRNQSLPAGETAHAVAGQRHCRLCDLRPVHGRDAADDRRFRIREAVNRDATIALLDRIGPSILMPHSQSAAPVWLAADARPH